MKDTFLQGHFYSYLESFIDLSCISKARTHYKRNVIIQKKNSCIVSLAGKLFFKACDCFVFLNPEWTVSHESVLMSCTFRSFIYLIVLHHLNVLFISTCFSVTETCFAQSSFLSAFYQIISSSPLIIWQEKTRWCSAQCHKYVSDFIWITAMECLPLQSMVFFFSCMIIIFYYK